MRHDWRMMPQIYCGVIYQSGNWCNCAISRKLQRRGVMKKCVLSAFIIAADLACCYAAGWAIGKGFTKLYFKLMKHIGE
jgi:uncharacterized membrane protein YbhN (UPF0104 family)